MVHLPACSSSWCERKQNSTVSHSLFFLKYYAAMDRYGVSVVMSHFTRWRVRRNKLARRDRGTPTCRAASSFKLCTRSCDVPFLIFLVVCFLPEFRTGRLSFKSILTVSVNSIDSDSIMFYTSFLPFLFLHVFFFDVFFLMLIVSFNDIPSLFLSCFLMCFISFLMRLYFFWCFWVTVFFFWCAFFWSFTPKMKRTAQTFCWWNQRKCWQEYFWCWIDTSWCIWCHSEAAKAFLPCFFETIFCAQNNGIFFCNAHHENTETYHPRPAPCYITIITLW